MMIILILIIDDTLFLSNQIFLNFEPSWTGPLFPRKFKVIAENDIVGQHYLFALLLKCLSRWYYLHIFWIAAG
jgi:hypothetical protein